MKMLFLDDMNVRQKSFNGQLHDTFGSEVHQDHDVSCAVNADEAFRLINVRDFDVMFLDHDLADAHYSEHRTGELTEIPDKEKSGTEVAEAISLLPNDRLPKLVVIHSWNRYGADRMARILRTRNINVLQVMFSDDLLKTVLPFLPE